MSIFERYGNWVANSRLPQLPFARRLAKSNPEDYGKYALYVFVMTQISLYIRSKAVEQRVRREIQKDALQHLNDAFDEMIKETKTPKSQPNIP